MFQLNVNCLYACIAGTDLFLLLSDAYKAVSLELVLGSLKGANPL